MDIADIVMTVSFVNVGIRKESPGTKTVSVGCGVAGKSRLPLAHTFSVTNF